MRGSLNGRVVLSIEIALLVFGAPFRADESDLILVRFRGRLEPAHLALACL